MHDVETLGFVLGEVLQPQRDDPESCLLDAPKYVAGVPGFEVTLWYGMLAPAGTPAAIVTRLSQDIEKVLRQPAMRERFSSLEITPSTSEALAELIKREIPKWRKVFESARLAPE